MPSIGGFIYAVGRLVYDSITLFAGLALLIFLWGLVRFIFKMGGDEKAAKEGKNLMVWGVIALFVMFSVWGIVFFLQSELNLPGAQKGILPSRGAAIWNASFAPNQDLPSTPVNNIYTTPRL